MHPAPPGGKDWKNYQETAAAFFRGLGLNATVEAKLEGARGLHCVDVYAEGTYAGIAFKWVVECKAWKTNVPKEKVMALAAIVDDVGADRGFLLSEKGFQAGAIRAAAKTNITLTNLGELSAGRSEELADAIIGRLHWRLSKAQTRLRDIRKARFDYEFFPPMIKELGRLMVLDQALGDALRNEYPTIYAVENDNRLKAATLEELALAADQIIGEAERWDHP